MQRHTDYGLYAKVYRAGASGYYAALPRGHAEVKQDDKRYVYDLRGRRNVSQFRTWVQQAFTEGKLLGRYPRYSVE